MKLIQDESFEKDFEIQSFAKKLTNKFRKLIWTYGLWPIGGYVYHLRLSHNDMYEWAEIWRRMDRGNGEDTGEPELVEIWVPIVRSPQEVFRFAGCGKAQLEALGFTFNHSIEDRGENYDIMRRGKECYAVNHISEEVAK